jgi:hypothetical protein
MDVVDIAAKVAIPTSILLSTCAYNTQQTNAHAEENCINLQIQLFQLVCTGNSCAVPQDRASHLIGLNTLIKQRCENAGLRPSEQVEIALNQAAQASSVEVAAQIQSSIRGGPPAITASAQPLALAPQTSVPAGNGQPNAGPSTPRVFVQVVDPNQRTAAQLVIARLKGREFRQSKLEALGPEVVPNARVSKPEVRCLKKDDCPAARDLASYVEAITGNAVSVTDISARYENDANVRPNTYEIWFPAGPILSADSRALAIE